ncbi:hypothetical protein [Thalassobius vesicularis]|uniref:hypothetical protein n=1 Tax=Thalassobius vesicularis TaxID=1294297 RepID=UPI001454CF7B|nr:hypothetical protein [Thalassobius vesicularis]
MFEATATVRTKEALEKARVERAVVLRALIRVVLKPRIIPLGRPVLTGSSRCPN